MAKRVGAALKKQADALFVFGGILAETREKKHLSLGQVAQRATAAGAPISRSEVFQLEQGARVRVDAVLVYELARIYGLDYPWLLNVLRWNRAHPTATSLPANWSIEEGDMVVRGHEEEFVRRFRALTPTQQHRVYQYLGLVESDDTSRGAGRPEATFPKRPRR